MTTPITDVKPLGAKEDTVTELHSVEPVGPDDLDPLEVDRAYLSASRTTQIFRGVLFQMIMFGRCVTIKVGS